MEVLLLVGHTVVLVLNKGGRRGAEVVLVVLVVGLRVRVVVIGVEHDTSSRVVNLLVWWWWLEVGFWWCKGGRSWTELLLARRRSTAVFRRVTRSFDDYPVHHGSGV